MKKLFYPWLLIGFLASCTTQTNQDAKQEVKQEDQPEKTARVDSKSEDLIGSYVGAFGDNKITVIINKAQNDSIEGRSVVGGNDRTFSGKYTIEGNKVLVDAKEPGDDVNDGHFQFSFSSADKNTLTGTWAPFQKDKKEKTFSLERKTFEYRKDVGHYPEASQRLLKPEDVENMMKEDLRTMRNEIFARHGYCFKKKDMRQEFEMYDWYVPATVSIVDKLTDIEDKNIKLIKQYEQYAEEYGDVYGR